MVKFEQCSKKVYGFDSDQIEEKKLANAFEIHSQELESNHNFWNTIFVTVHVANITAGHTTHSRPKILLSFRQNYQMSKNYMCAREKNGRHDDWRDIDANAIERVNRVFNIFNRNCAL